MKMAKLFIPVGIPGCGKSTWAEHMKSDCFVVSTDGIREHMAKLGDLESVSDMSRNDEVFAKYHSDIEFHLHRGDDVYADATNLRDYAREKLSDIAKRCNAAMHVIVFNNLHEAIGRNLKRERVVPIDAMVAMLEHFEKALRDIPEEQYTSITFIKSLT